MNIKTAMKWLENVSDGDRVTKSQVCAIEHLKAEVVRLEQVEHESIWLLNDESEKNNEIADLRKDRDKRKEWIEARKDRARAYNLDCE